VLCLGVVAMVAVLAAASFRMPPQYPRPSCGACLRQIGLALHMYANDYDGYFPPPDGAEGLEMLRKLDYLPAMKVYRDPRVLYDRRMRNYRRARGCRWLYREPSLDLTPPLTEDKLDYVYRGGLSIRFFANAPVAWDRPGSHEDFGNILFVDGHVKGYAGSDWMKRTKTDNE